MRARSPIGELEEGAPRPHKNAAPMQSLRSQVASALLAPLEISPEQLVLLPTKEAKFGDYQCNSAMAEAKKRGLNPRQLAEGWSQRLQSELQGMARCEVAGPGFLNLTLEDDWLRQQLETFDPERWESPVAPKTVVLDYSSPNVAKEMHIGHIRSTIIGDAIARILAFAGHRVIRQNHLGDWGTQFGMLCTQLRDHPELAQADLSSIEELYRQANQRFQNDPDFEQRARATVVALHNGDPEVLELWQQIVELSRRHFQPLYQRLGVQLERGDERGESAYRHLLQGVVDWFRENFSEPRNGMQVRISDGAVCVFHFDADGNPQFLNADKEPLPFIIQKSDGAFLYSTTDLAACRFRVNELGADEILAVVGAPQALHFEMLIATCRKAGFLNPPDRNPVEFQHIAFGSVLGEDRRPLKTRSGGTVKLAELLDEAVERARRKLQEISQDRLSPEEVDEVAEVIGMGAVKYADLSQNRTSDYVFSWDKMLSLQGNTVVYLLYVLARINGIREKAGASDSTVAFRFEHPHERALALQVLRFPETLEGVMAEWKINHLADYLNQLASSFMGFYENCPVLDAEGELRESRLRLCTLTARTMAAGLSLLGIRTVRRM